MQRDNCHLVRILGTMHNHFNSQLVTRCCSIVVHTVGGSVESSGGGYDGVGRRLIETQEAPALPADN